MHQYNTIILPAHTRSIFFKFPYEVKLQKINKFKNYNRLAKFTLNLPEFHFASVRVEDKAGFYYYPVEEGRDMLSPLPNTAVSGNICLSDIDINLSDQSIIKFIYNSYWNLESYGSLSGYIPNIDTNFGLDAYIKFLQNWQKSGKVELKAW